MPDRIDAEDLARAERVLWRAERLSLDEANAIAAAYPPPPSDPPELTDAYRRARALAEALGFELRDDARDERIDRAAMSACGTYAGMVDFIHNFGPEAPLIWSIHHAWLAALLGGRLKESDDAVLTKTWRVIADEPTADRFGPRTESCEAFVLRAANITAAEADRLGSRWDGAAYDRTYELLRDEPAYRERAYGHVSHLTCDAVERALTGRVGGFGTFGDLARDHPWRRASYLAGTAAIAECLRDVAPSDLLARLEGPWLAVDQDVMQRRSAHPSGSG